MLLPNSPRHCFALYGMVHRGQNGWQYSARHLCDRERRMASSLHWFISSVSHHLQKGLKQRRWHGFLCPENLLDKTILVVSTLIQLFTQQLLLNTCFSAAVSGHADPWEDKADGIPGLTELIVYWERQKVNPRKSEPESVWSGNYCEKN